jgi:mediator of RNA polymerase II transcription subunit 10
VPPELLEYVENGRNPDIYTREFVELVRRGNHNAFASFRDILADTIYAEMPEVQEDVVRVVEATGGRRPGGPRDGAGAQVAPRDGPDAAARPATGT